MPDAELCRTLPHWVSLVNVLPASGFGHRHDVFDVDARLAQALFHSLTFLLHLSAGDIVSKVEDGSSLHLVKYRVVRRVDLIPSVDICRQQPSILALAEGVDLVCTGVRPKTSRAVEVIRVRRTPARVIRGNAQVVKVELSRDYGRRSLQRLAGDQVRLDLVAKDLERMIRLIKKHGLAREAGQKCRRKVREVVFDVGAAVHFVGFCCS